MHWLQYNPLIARVTLLGRTHTHTHTHTVIYVCIHSHKIAIGIGAIISAIYNLSYGLLLDPHAALSLGLEFAPAADLTSLP